ncbi:MAG: amidoligase family protein [Clostridia bacterium]|nr:amidoligase family protein [Clostridia bacterium]
MNDGIEIVSHPATLDYHLHNIPWKAVMQRARELKYLSHTAQTCGLHVHINRAALGETVEEQENTIGRIVYFFEKFWTEILRFSRRTEGQANRWAARYGCSIENPKETLKNVKKSYLGRYVAVNLTNQFTVELRIFRGTLKYETFAATLQFVDKLCHDAIELSDEQFQTMTWADFAKSVKDMPELTDYLKIRGLEAK